ncbi:MAG: carboxylating nicotinate-nucleotide diphosphorylase [Candidatus Bathyarchaeota archaeon]|nr:carboxylating nicotinate-nucleotide diphosphorylase [Candidatus Bathyarchaeota archaeon]
MFVPRRVLEEKLLEFVAEDVGQGDVTAAAVIPAGLKAKAVVLAKAKGIVAGVEEVEVLAQAFGLQSTVQVTDGSQVKKGQVLLELTGDAQTILCVERTLLNLLSRMSGIATTTHKIADKLKQANIKTRIAATRKTSLGFLYFDKKAVMVGGGDSHRLHLDDLVLIKDNHLALAGGLENALERAKQNVSAYKKIEVEVTSAVDAVKAVQLGADVVMLDNFAPKQIRESVALLEEAGVLGKVLLEVSGGVTEQNIEEFAVQGVDIISLGALTHSVEALDISLKMTPL